MSIRKDLRALRREAVRQGWTAERNGSGHYTLTSPSGAKVTMPATPGRGRAYENVLSCMKARGYRPPGQRRRRRNA